MSIEFIVKLLLSILLTYRLARMVALEEGAFGIFHAIREKVDPYQKTWVGRGVNCPLCCGFWLALFPAWYLTGFSSVDWFILVWLGIAGAQTYLQETEGKL